MISSTPAELCRDIRRNRHVGHEHNQLDALEHSLQDGPSFIRRDHRKILDVEGADVDGGDDVVRIDFTSYVREVEEINTRLESIAHPPHQLRILRITKHTADIPLSSSRHGIHTINYERKEEKDKKDKDKTDKGKKETEEEAEKELNEVKKKLEKEEEDAERLATKEKHEQAKLKHVEEIAVERDTHVERLLQSKIEEDPIDQVHKVAGVINELNQSHSPKHHEEDPIDQVRQVAKVMNDINQFNGPRRQEQVPIDQIHRVAGVIHDLQHTMSHHSRERIHVDVSNSASAHGTGGRAASLDSYAHPLYICDSIHHSQKYHYPHHEHHPEVIYHSQFASTSSLLVSTILIHIFTSHFALFSQIIAAS